MSRSRAWPVILLIAGACERSAPPAPPARGKLPPGIAAQVGDESVRLETVQRVAAAQNVSLEQARERALSDALFGAEAARAVHPAVRRVTERGVLARALLEGMARAAEAEGPPTDAELDAIIAQRWPELDRPESARVTHAVALFPEGNEKKREEVLRVARAIEVAVRDASDADAFIRAARAVPRGSIEVRAERLPPITPDGRGWTSSLSGDHPAGTYDAAFARAANALSRPGEQSGLVETRFGFHVLRLEERYPERRIPRADLRRVLEPEVFARRARERERALRARLEAEVEIAVARNVDALTALGE
ncbi:MAG TPA: peptidyl-prolyl cis-trans isomerase [Polyangiaceae bacterium]|nr:peptidyl-prolyl cis-trans isomerase [Polyangiaceae bacterium]